MSDLDRVSKLANIMLEKERRVAILEEELKNEKSALNTIKCEDLPELMREVGLSELRLTTGERLITKEEVSCNISAEHRPQAMAWLLAHGFGGLIKTIVAVEFGRGEVEQAEALACKLNEDNLPATAQETVHPATLKAFVKEQLAAGKSVPFDLFGVHPYTIATFLKK